MLHYLIDGYNLLFYLSTLDQLLEREREKLIAQLLHYSVSLHLKFTVVFDAYAAEGELSLSHQGPLHIVYTPEGVTADEWIIDSVSQAIQPKQIAVVSSDRQLNRTVRSLGAHTATANVFVRDMEKRLRKEKRAKQRHVSEDTRKEHGDQHSGLQLSSTLLSYYEELFQRRDTELQRKERPSSIKTTPSQPFRSKPEESPSTPQQTGTEKSAPEGNREDDLLEYYRRCFEERWRKMKGDGA